MTKTGSTKPFKQLVENVEKLLVRAGGNGNVHAETQNEAIRLKKLIFIAGQEKCVSSGVTVTKQFVLL